MSHVDDVFGLGGFLAEKFEGYRPRKGQVIMARAVTEAIRKQEHLIVEGPTGVGKSLAYLVPSIEHATGFRENSRVPKGRVIVVTGGIALQEQLVAKDLPSLRTILKQDFTFALMKGKNNFLCVEALGKTMAEAGVVDGKQLSLVGGDPQLARLLSWAQQTKTGDMSEFPETPAPQLWRKLSVSSDECKGSVCKEFFRCFAETAKRKAESANVVVTNYHLFFAHLVVRAKMREIRAAGGTCDLDVVLPPADVIVFDEAHKAAEIARDFLGFQFTRNRVEWLFKGFNHELGQQAKIESDRFFASLALLKKSRNYRSRLKRGHGLRGEVLADLLERIGRFYKDSIAVTSWSDDEKAELEIRARSGVTMAFQLREAMSPENNSETVYFLEENQKGDVGIKSKPIAVAEWLKTELFEQFKTVVVTSATLATGSGRDPFGFIRRELGLEKSAELVAESPFKFGDQVMLVIPKTMGDPKNFATYTGEVAEHVRDVADAARGRTLGLFTSYKNMEASRDACRNLPFRVFTQKDGPRTLMVQKFREDTSSVLLGCESFWAGVDVTGESLSCVVIDRLPFPTPDDPIIDAISEKDDRWFFNYAIPRAIIAVKQGFGRLIRSETDRGCVVILDQRIVRMSYGRQFLAALPQVCMADEVADVRTFLDKGAA